MMTVKELIKRLEGFNPDSQVVVGSREYFDVDALAEYVVSQRHVNRYDLSCEIKVGDKVVHIDY